MTLERVAMMEAELEDRITVYGDLSKKLYKCPECGRWLFWIYQDGEDAPWVFPFEGIGITYLETVCPKCGELVAFGARRIPEKLTKRGGEVLIDSEPENE